MSGFLRRFAVPTMLAAACFVINTVSAQAQATRTFVSGHGADTGTCGVTSPCRSFAYAITQTAVAGEIVVLDSAGYGPITITQSLTITNPGGVEAGVTASSGNNAVTINATPTSVVTLRGLTLEGGDVGSDGISVISTLPLSGSETAASVNIAACVIKDFTGNGINVAPSVTGTTGFLPTLNVLVTDSLVWNNQLSGIGLTMPALTQLNALVDRTGVDENGTGIIVNASGGTIRAMLSSMHAISNATNGIANTEGSVVMKDSTVYFTNTTTDIVNNGTIDLYNDNTIGGLNNQGSVFSDGTNNIASVTGNAIQKQNPQ